MNKLKFMIITIIILSMITSATVIMAINTGSDNSLEVLNRTFSRLSSDKKTGYEELFNNKELEYSAFIRYQYTEINEGSTETRDTIAVFDYYLTISNITENSVTYSGEVKMNQFSSDDPSDKDYVMKLVSTYEFNTLTKRTGYPVISIIDYIKGFLKNSDFSVEKWESKVGLSTLSIEDHSIAISTYVFNISGKVDISGAKNAYFTLSGYANYHDYLSIPIKYYVKATIVAETDTQKVILNHETKFVLKDNELKSLIDISSTQHEHYSIGDSTISVRIVARNAEIKKNAIKNNVLVLTVNGDGLGFLNIEVNKPLSINKILIDGVEKEYIIIVESQDRIILTLPVTLSNHIVEIYFENVKTPSQAQETTTQTTIGQETMRQTTTTTQESEKINTKLTITTEENKTYLYLIAGGIFILIVLMVIILIVILMYRKK